jgi:hypothetical protein
MASTPVPELRPLAGDIDSLLAAVDTTLTTVPEDRHPPPSLPDLRASYDAFAQRISQAGDHAASLLLELDEIRRRCQRHARDRRAGSARQRRRAGRLTIQLSGDLVGQGRSQATG